MFLLTILYLAFINLGLPDAMLGSAWPLMHKDLSTSLATAGFLSTTVCIGTVVSSLLTYRIVAKLGTGLVTVLSVVMTAIALFCISITPNVFILFLCAIPLGLGGGTVDAALNHFVALHYKSSHMNWLHCFWGVGASTGPAIMSFYLMNNDWRGGYFLVGVCQFLMAVFLFSSLSAWKDKDNKNKGKGVQTKIVSNQDALKTPYVKFSLLAFFFYCATELTAGLWGSSYLVEAKGLSKSDAALWISFYYAGIMIGRFASGFIATKIKSYLLIRIGQMTWFCGAIFLVLPLPISFSMFGFILLGLGGAPIFPSMLHETPHRFGKNLSQTVIGLQMAFAYIGNAVAPLVFGELVSLSTISLFPIFLSFCMFTTLLSTEKLQECDSVKIRKA